MRSSRPAWPYRKKAQTTLPSVRCIRRRPRQRPSWWVRAWPGMFWAWRCLGDQRPQCVEEPERRVRRDPRGRRQPIADRMIRAEDLAVAIDQMKGRRAHGTGRTWTQSGCGRSGGQNDAADAHRGLRHSAQALHRHRASGPWERRCRENAKREPGEPAAASLAGDPQRPSASVLRTQSMAHAAHRQAKTSKKAAPGGKPRGPEAVWPGGPRHSTGTIRAVRKISSVSRSRKS